jgi:hypothetical protein
VLATVTGALCDEVIRAHTAEEARINKGWALLHQATERCRLLDQRAAEHREQAGKEAEDIRASATEEAEEALANARESARGVLARAHQEAMKIVSEARQKIPPTAGPPNPALAGEEAKRAAQHLLDEARTNADGLLANAQRRLDEVEDREALLHAREESADSRAESLSLQEAGLAVREAEARERERGLRLREEQLHALEDRLNREREALESREAMASQSNNELIQRQEALNQREASLQAKMDHMLNQRRVSMEQEFERRRAEFTEACRADFRAKTDDALAMYKQKREILECQVRDLETELRGAHEALSVPLLKRTPPSPRSGAMCRGSKRRTWRRPCRAWRPPGNSRRLGIPRRRYACCEGSGCRCSAGSRPASWRRRTAWASTG